VDHNPGRNKPFFARSASEKFVHSCICIRDDPNAIFLIVKLEIFMFQMYNSTACRYQVLVLIDFVSGLKQSCVQMLLNTSEKSKMFWIGLGLWFYGEILTYIPIRTYLYPYPQGS